MVAENNPMQARERSSIVFDINNTCLSETVGVVCTSVYKTVLFMFYISKYCDFIRYKTMSITLRISNFISVKNKK